MIESIKKVAVKYNGELVGNLLELDDCSIAFQYSKNWLEHGFSISPFSLPLVKKTFISNSTYFNGLFGVFADSLPDGWGELLTIRMLMKNDINPSSVTALQRLCLISETGLGALTYEPVLRLKTSESDIDFDTLADESRKILSEHESNADLDNIYRLGGSSGGSRPKTHIKYEGEDWIVKFSFSGDPANMGEKEFKANLLARECGINVNEFKLFESKRCSGYFGCKRFDRDGTKRIHMISLCALLETTHRIPNLDYFHLFQTIRNICNNEEEVYEAYRRMCFNVFFQNKDDHGKNFAFLYDEELKRYKLSPAFDTTPTPNRYEHEMTVNGNGNPKEKDLLSIGKSFGLSMDKCKKIIEAIKNKI